MTTQIRTTLLTTLLFFGLLTGLQAQDKYEFAVVTYSSWSGYITISLNGTSFRKIEVPKEDSENSFDANPILKQVNILAEDGWEVFDTGAFLTSGLSSIYIFYLRRKVE